MKPETKETILRNVESFLNEIDSVSNDVEHKLGALQQEARAEYLRQREHLKELQQRWRTELDDSTETSEEGLAGLQEKLAKARRSLSELLSGVHLGGDDGRLPQLESRNPHTNEVVATYPQQDDGQIDEAIGASVRAQRHWAAQPIANRAQALTAVAQQLRANAQVYAALMTDEMGKPITQAEAEVEKCARLCDFYAAKAPAFLDAIEVESDAQHSEVVFRPLGVVLAIMPWNFPFWQAMRFAAPALAAGNGVILKHAGNVSGCALALQRLFAEALPADLFRTLIAASDRLADVIADPRINAVTFTGSTSAGRKVGQAAGRALKKAVLELGGSDPYVVLADADLDQAAEICAASRLVNGGQSCIAAKRFIVVESVYDAFLDKFSARMLARTTGDPSDRNVAVGPLARRDLAQQLHEQVQASLSAGAQLVAGGGDPDGAHYPVTLLAEVQPGMVAAEEELFGPVAAVLRAEDTDAAVALANRSRFGLGGAVFTSNSKVGLALAREALDAGTVVVNGQVQSDPRLPFGGIKDSGYGRELGEFGIREFVNVKTISLF